MGMRSFVGRSIGVAAVMLGLAATGHASAVETPRCRVLVRSIQEVRRTSSRDAMEIRYEVVSPDGTRRFVKRFRRGESFNLDLGRGSRDGDSPMPTVRVTEVREASRFDPGRVRIRYEVKHPNGRVSRRETDVSETGVNRRELDLR